MEYSEEVEQQEVNEEPQEVNKEKQEEQQEETKCSIRTYTNCVII